MAAVTGKIDEAHGLEQIGRLDEAEAIYLRLLEADPHDVTVLNLLGLLCHRRGRNSESAALIVRALELNPADAQALGNLGAVQIALGDRPAAVANFRRAAALAPADAGAWSNLALALLDGGDASGAVDAYRRAIALDPKRPRGLRQLAKAHFAVGDFATAAEVYARAAVEEPADADNWSNLGAARHRLDDLAGARTALQEAIRLDPCHAAAWCNLGTVENDSGDDKAAIANFERTTAIDPQHVDGHVFRGVSLLRSGRFAEGWAEYEWRLKQRDGPRVDRGFAAPMWRGENFAGRRLLIHAEQGLGDTIQFMRYLPLVQERGGEIMFEVQAPLRRLIAASPLARGVNVVAEGTALPPFDLYCPLLSLPTIFGTDLASIPGGAAYLFGDCSLMPPLPARSRQRRWGLVWAGNPRHPADRRRSLPASALDRLSAIEDVEFISLQVAPAARPEKLALIDAAPLLEDFATTAAVLADVDLVITVDTAVAHLAGAMGMPACVLLNHVADWRWLAGRSDSPWYPSFGLFRQPRPGDWDSVLDRIVDEAAQGG
jgi:Flp pilus assembly protein TadD